MEFKHIQNEDIALIISQAESKDFKADEKIKILQIKERISYPLNGRTISLEAGTCKKEESCSRITWNEDRYRITITAKMNPPELVKIAESMLP